MIKLIASDLDGTLLRGGAQSLDPEIFTLIRELKEQGILFTAASGRQYYNMRRLFAPVKDDIAYICENGTLGMFHGELFSEEHIPRDTGQEILRAIQKEENCELLLSTRNTHYIEKPSARYEHHMRNVVGNDVITVDDIFSVEDPYLKISVCCFDGIRHITPYFQEHFSEKLNVTPADLIWLDTTPKNIHKGYTLQKLLDMLHILPEECMSFGDQHNDIEMLKLTGQSYAMDTAVPELIDIADGTTADVAASIREILHLK